jgi:hypothetical protein
MKTTVPFLKMFFMLVSLALVNNQIAAQSELLTNGLSFKNPVLETANNTDKKVGAVYLFEDVAQGIDARLRIDSLINGAKVSKIDDNTSGLGYEDALQPEVQSGNVIGESYAVFTVTFYTANTTIVKTLQSVNATALDIDGNLTLKEFAELRMGNGGTASYMGTTLDLSLLDLLIGKFKAMNILGIERTGIDTTAFTNMFTAKNGAVSSFSIKYGTATLLPTTTDRQFSLYMKGFTYPSQITLPVELISFSAVLNGNKADLKWTTATEKNVSHFVVERSTDGKEFEQAGIVFAYGNTSDRVNYSFSDTKINTSKPGMIYYRLRSVDIDERNQLSTVKMIRIGKQDDQQIAILTYPNPVTTELRVTIPGSWQGKKVSYEVLNNNGRLSIRTEATSSSQTETIHVGQLGTGVYFVKATCNGVTAVQKIVKQ